MRGKHGKSAQVRRDWTELEQRATSAEQRAERLEAELAKLQEASERRLVGLRSELAEAVKARDAAALPALTAAETQIRELRKSGDALEARAKVAERRADQISKAALASIDKLDLPEARASFVKMLVSLSMNEDDGLRVISRKMKVHQALGRVGEISGF